MTTLVKDTIYSLKQDYGVPIVAVKLLTNSLNLETGAQTKTKTEYNINLAIVLPLKGRTQYLRTVGSQKVGLLDSGLREILIDSSDLAVDLETTDYIVYKNQRADVIAFDRYDGAVIITVKSVKGMPLA